jgi:hypothetical protein
MTNVARRIGSREKRRVEGLRKFAVLPQKSRHNIEPNNIQLLQRFLQLKRRQIVCTGIIHRRLLENISGTRHIHLMTAY